jgi:formylmethanofuran dehydrogenase subunit C
MSALTLTLNETPRQRVDLSPLTPDLLKEKSPPEISAIELSSGNRRLRVSELFSLSGDDPSSLVIKNSCDKLDRIGQAMNSGSITVHGDAGAYLGFAMKNGAITVHGNVGAYAASTMKNGLLHIRGNADDFLAAAIPGDRHGMKGGMVIVTGNAGDRVGDHMLRGAVLIEGNAGDFCASRMLAGTIAVLGKAASFAGHGMKRGTLLLNTMPNNLPATFNDCGVHYINYLPLLIKSWQSLDSKFARLELRSRVRRYMGDLANAGKGEILVLVN